MEQNVTALCSAFNHNGQLLITGLSNGNILIHDLRQNEIIDNLNCHSSPIIDIELINDFTNICAQSEDGKLCQRSLNHSGKILWETKIKIEKNPVHGKLFTFDQSGSYMLLCTQTGGNIYKVYIFSLYNDKLRFLTSPRNHLHDVRSEKIYGKNWCRICRNKTYFARIFIAHFLVFDVINGVPRSLNSCIEVQICIYVLFI